MQSAQRTARLKPLAVGHTQQLSDADVRDQHHYEVYEQAIFEGAWICTPLTALRGSA